MGTIRFHMVCALVVVSFFSVLQWFVVPGDEDPLFVAKFTASVSVVFAFFGGLAIGASFIHEREEDKGNRK